MSQHETDRQTDHARAHLDAGVSGANPTASRPQPKLALVAFPVLVAVALGIFSMTGTPKEEPLHLPDEPAEQAFKPYQAPEVAQQDVKQTPDQAQLAPSEIRMVVEREDEPEPKPAAAAKPSPTEELRPYIHIGGEKPPPQVYKPSKAELAFRKRALKGNPLYKSPLLRAHSNKKQRAMLRRFNAKNYRLGTAPKVTLSSMYRINPEHLKTIKARKAANQRVVTIKKQ